MISPKPMRKPLKIANIASTKVGSVPVSQRTEKDGEYNIDDTEIEPLTIIFTSDYNIVCLHDRIVSKLKSKKKIPELKEQLELLNRKIQLPQTANSRMNTIAKIERIIEEIETIESEKLLDEYLETATPLIEEYQNIGPKKKRVDFFKKEQEVFFDEIDKRRVAIIMQFLDLAKKYTEIEYLHKLPSSNACRGCFQDLSLSLSENSTIICSNCGAVNEIPTPKESSSTSTTKNQDYSDGENFYQALLRYQGKQNKKIPTQVYKELDAYFTELGQPTSDVIKSSPLNTEGKRGKTSLQLLYKALQETNNSEYYEDANLIAHEYWGWLLPDVSHLEALILEDYKKTQKVYRELEKDRKSSLGTQFRLFKHLQLRGHKCSVSDFKIATNPESIETNEGYWKIMCELCGDPEIYYIPTF